jgi:hypothetical protein
MPQKMMAANATSCEEYHVGSKRAYSEIVESKASCPILSPSNTPSNIPAGITLTVAGGTVNFCGMNTPPAMQPPVVIPITVEQKPVIPTVILEQPNIQQQPVPVIPEDQPELFCICKKPNDVLRSMIECSSEHCLGGKWYHYDCLNMKKSAKKCKWICPLCAFAI